MKVKSIEITAPGILEIAAREVDFQDNLVLNLECSAISPLDQQISQGFFPLVEKWPLIPGTSGVAADSNGSRFFVFAEGAGGGFRRSGVHQETFSFPHDVLFPIPGDIPSETIAISMISFLSIFSIYAQLENISAPSKILVLGANGSIGEAALSVAEHLGLQSTGVTRQGVKVLGRDTLTYEDLIPNYGGSGFNVIIDPLGGTFTKKAAGFAEPGSRHVVIGLSGGISIEVDGGDLLGKGYHFEGFNLLRIPLPEIALYAQRTFDYLKSSDYHPNYASRFTLASGVEAYAAALKSKERVLLTR